MTFCRLNPWIRVCASTSQPALKFLGVHMPVNNLQPVGGKHSRLSSTTEAKMQQRGIVRILLCAALLVSTAAVTFGMWPGAAQRSARNISLQGTTQLQQMHSSNYTVPLDLFVMSKCPDASACEHAMGKVLADLSAITTVKTYYIADVADDSFKVCPS